MSKEKLKEYLKTLSKDRVAEFCLQYKFDAEIAEQQLAEKDKEIERLKNLFKLNNEVVINQGKEIFDLRVQILQQKQNQTQLAIQELEKVKDYICDCTYIKEPDYTNVRCKIDQQIKELKGE